MHFCNGTALDIALEKTDNEVDSCPLCSQSEKKSCAMEMSADHPLKGCKDVRIDTKNTDDAYFSVDHGAHAFVAFPAIITLHWIYNFFNFSDTFEAALPTHAPALLAVQPVPTFIINCTFRI